jgi:hypothetical protein
VRSERAAGRPCSAAHHLLMCRCNRLLQARRRRRRALTPTLTDLVETPACAAVALNTKINLHTATDTNRSLRNCRRA